MNDLISREAAIDAFMTSTADGDKAEWCEWVLKKVPPAQQWISVYKDLPDSTNDVLVCARGRMMICFYDPDTAKWYWYNGERELKYVTAWMPLPTPYRGGAE